MIEKDLEPESVREESQTVFIVYRTHYNDDNIKSFIIQAVFDKKEDAEQYAEDEFTSSGYGTIEEKVLK